MRKSNRKNAVTEVVNTRRAKNQHRFIRTSFNVQKTKSLLLLSIFSLSTLATIISGPLALATPSPDVSIEQCTAEKGKWESDNSGGWCSVAPASRNPKFVGQAWAVTNAFYRCVANSDHQLIDNTPAGQRITEEHMRAGTWFKDNATQDIFSGAPFKVASSFLVDNVGERGEVLCNTTIKEVADLTGYGTDYRSMYCDVIPVKADGTSCTGDSGDFSGTGRGGGQLYTYADDFYNMIKRKAFRAEAPPITGAARYLIYLSAFQGSNGCHANPTASPGNNENKIYRNVKIVNSAGTGIDLKTFEGEIRTDKRWVYTDQNKQDQQMACQDIADQLSANAEAFMAWAKNHPNDLAAAAITDIGGKQTNAPGTNTPTCAIEAIGWIICPVMRFMSQIVDQAYGAISTMLNTPAIDTSTSDVNPMYKAWSTMRSFANIVFVIGFLVIIFSQLTSVGLTNYGIKKMLPRLIIAAILVNISYWICAIAVDISNILGMSLKSLMNTTGSSLYVDAGVADSGAGGIWDGLTVGLLASTAAITVIYLGVSILLPMLIAATLAIVTVVLVLTLRQALIIILVVISPLAFVAYLLPNTEKWFTKWRELFQVLLLMFPIIAVVFGGSALASTIISGVANSSEKPNFILQVMAAGITIIPLFIVPVVMKTAGGLLNRFGGMVNNPNKGPFDRMKKGAERIRNNSAYVRGKNARQQLKQSRKNREFADQYELGRKIASGEENLRAPGMSALEVSKRAAAVRAFHASRGPASALDAAARFASAAGQNSSNPMAQYLGARAAQVHSLTGAEGRADDLSELSEHYKSEVEKATEAALKDAVRSLGKEIATVRATGGDTDAFLKTRATDASQTSTARDAALHTAASLGRDGVIRDLDTGGLVPKESIQQAITANAGSLINKAPDLVKPKGVAFNSVNGGELSKFSAGTAAEYMKHLNDLKTSGSADYAGALASFKSAIVDIQKSSDLQGAFKSDVGNALLKASAGTALSADIGTERSGLNTNAGKIR
jgi:hypothetical protein